MEREKKNESNQSERMQTIIRPKKKKKSDKRPLTYYQNSVARITFNKQQNYQRLPTTKPCIDDNFHIYWRYFQDSMH